MCHDIVAVNESARSQCSAHCHLEIGMFGPHAFETPWHLDCEGNPFEHFEHCPRDGADYVVVRFEIEAWLASVKENEIDALRGKDHFVRATRIFHCFSKLRELLDVEVLFDLSINTCHYLFN